MKLYTIKTKKDEKEYFLIIETVIHLGENGYDLEYHLSFTDKIEKTFKAYFHTEKEKMNDLLSFLNKRNKTVHYFEIHDDFILLNNYYMDFDEFQLVEVEI